MGLDSMGFRLMYFSGSHGLGFRVPPMRKHPVIVTWG